MPNPKRRHSIARGRKRRTHWKAHAPQTMVCPHCKRTKLPHRICPFCGYYNGKEMISIETVAERKRRKEKKREDKKKSE